MQTNPTPPPPQHRETRRRLLDAGVRLFAEHGFRSVSVRDLCTEAGANIAAINYHFGGKQELYEAIFDDILDSDEPRYREWLENLETLLASSNREPGQLTVVAQIFVKGMLAHLIGDQCTRWFGVLVMRELAFPTAPFELIYQRRAEPSQEILAKIIAAATGEPATSAAVRTKAHALTGMMINMGVSRSILWRRMDWDGYTPERVSHINDVITDLICGALDIKRAPKTFTTGEIE